MIIIDVNLDGLPQTTAKLRALQPSIMRAVAAKVTSLTLQVEARAKAKVSGPVLNVRTGNLRRSLQNKIDKGEKQVKGTVYSAGDVKYAAIHELGGVIPAFTMKEHIHTNLFGRGIVATIPAYTHPGVHMPKRAYLKPSLEEMTQAIKDGIADAVKKGVESL